MIRMLTRTTTLTITALALAASLASAHSSGNITGTVSHIEPATRTIHFVDGRMVVLEPGAVITVNGREVTLDGVAPGSTTTVVSATPARGTVTVPSGHPLVDVSGTVANVDTTRGVITLQDGRTVALTGQSTVWQPTSQGSIQPGTQVYINNVQPMQVTAPGQPTAPGQAIAADTWMGTVASVDEANGFITLADGTAVRVAPGTRVQAAGRSVALSELRPGDQIVIRRHTRAAVPATSSRAVVAGPGVVAAPGGYASLPRGGAFASVTIDADEIVVMREPQAP